MEAFARDAAFAAVLATFVSDVAFGNVPSTVADYRASATMVAVLKKSEEYT